MSHFSREFYEILKTKLDDFKRFPKPVHYRMCLNFTKWRDRKMNKIKIKNCLPSGRIPSADTQMMHLASLVFQLGFDFQHFLHSSNFEETSELCGSYL